MVKTNNQELWRCRTTDPSALSAGIQLWAAWLDVQPEQLAGFWSTLSSHERGRARRFAFERDHVRFVAARGFLRKILSACLGEEPHRIEFRYSAEGKPSLSGAFAHSGVQFSLAHSGGLALFAVAHDSVVGIDVEQMRPLPGLSGLIERSFSARECALIGELSGLDQAALFFRVWTRKEAWLKATGEGITGSLNSVEVLGSVDGEGLAPKLEWDIGARRLRLHDLAPAPGFVGALAIGPGRF